MKPELRCRPSEDVCTAHDEPLISPRLCATGWQKYPLRHCNSLCFCQICEKDIVWNQRYYDGGYGRRAHILCVAAPHI